MCILFICRLLIPCRASLFTRTFSFHSTIFDRHVHGFLEEIGQGIQHIASRVDNIISFVQEANDRRKIFGEVSTVSNEDVSLLITCIHHARLLNHHCMIMLFLRASRS